MECWGRQRSSRRFARRVAVGVALGVAGPLTLVAALPPGGPAGATVAEAGAGAGDTLIDSDSIALDVNDRGVVVGWFASFDGTHAYRLDPDGELVDLGPGTARGVNNAGVVVGERPGPDGDIHATLWDADGTAHDLGLGALSSASDINDRGVAVATASRGTTTWESYVIPPHRRPRPLAAPPGLPTNLLVGDINERGDVVGFAFDPATRRSFPVLWRGPRRVPTALPASRPEGAGYTVHGINEGGTIVGNHDNGTGVATPVAWIGRRHREVLLGEPGVPAAVQDVNDRGSAVGSHDVSGEAVRWNVRTGRATVLPSPTGGRASAQAINDRGTIVGYAQVPDASLRAVRFTPG